MADANYYELLGVTSEATYEENHDAVDSDVESLTVGDQAALARRWSCLPMQRRVTALF